MIDELHAFTAIDTNILAKSNVGDLLPYIHETFSELDIKMNDESLQKHAILCEAAVFKNLLKEIKENYRKYGTNGKLRVETNSNHKLVITLTNNKKEKGAYDVSTKQGVNILKDYAEMLGGRLT